jgi:hypothetical protein
MWLVRVVVIGWIVGEMTPQRSAEGAFAAVWVEIPSDL